MIELSDISRIDEDAMSLVVRCECGVVNKFEFDVPMGTSGNSEIIKLIESEQKSNDLHEDVKKMIVEDSETRTELEEISFRLDKLEENEDKTVDLISSIQDRESEVIIRQIGLVDKIQKYRKETKETLDHFKHLVLSEFPELVAKNTNRIKNLEWAINHSIKQMTKACARYGIITPEPKEPDSHDAVFNPENRDAGASVVNLKGLFDEKVELDLTPKEFDECICGLAYNYSLHPDRTATEEDTKRMFSIMVEKAHMRREQSKEPEKKEVIRKCCKHTDCLRDLKDIVRGAQICRLIDDDCGYFVEETV